MTRLCSVDGCENPAWAKGLCGTHYSRLRRHGDVQAGVAVSKPYSGPCQVEGCTAISKARGLCGRHWQRWRTHGDPLAGATAKGEVPAFIEETVLPYRGDDCLIWPYWRSETGYAVATIEGQTRVVSRYVCERAHGPAPAPHYDAAHKCGRGHFGCVAPDHLVWATRSENNMHKVEHGTDNRGEKHPHAKLTKDDVLQIRAMRDTHLQKDIAKLFGISRETVGQIQRRQRWGWLENGE